MQAMLNRKVNDENTYSQRCHLHSPVPCYQTEGTAVILYACVCLLFISLGSGIYDSEYDCALEAVHWLLQSLEARHKLIWLKMMHVRALDNWSELLDNCFVASRRCQVTAKHRNTDRTGHRILYSTLYNTLGLLTISHSFSLAWKDMPSIAALYSLHTYTSASALPAYVWETFAAHPRDSNIMYPHAMQMRHEERSLNGLWLVCTTNSILSSPSVDFVLSCTDGPLGSYPVFIFTPIPLSLLYHDYARPRLQAIARALHTVVPPHRVFSVFAPEAVTIHFCSEWIAITGISLEPRPDYYAAKITYCTKRSFCPRQKSLFPDLEYDLRLAREDDLIGVAELCHNFALESEPFVLTKENALREAALLIQQGKLWVHEIRRCEQKPEIASIVAVTRTSDTVSAITKVYTNPRWRKRGCAERLTRQVTKSLLKTKETVVLYVAHNNPAAAKVYNRVGFVGIGPESEAVDGVDSWLELGFDRSKVQLGHW